MTETVVVTKLLRVGGLLLEVDLKGEARDGDPWSPYFAPAEARRLYEARKALLAGDLAKAQSLGRLFHVSPAHAAA